jgi:hypothetical protein
MSLSKYCKITAILLIALIVLLALWLIKKPLYEPEEKIIACIKDRTISLDELIRRAEYMVRPNYCKGNTNIHKKIILNSLIAEKLLAIEGENRCELLNNPHFQRYIQGRKEQAMRQVLYSEVAYKKVKLDTSEINKMYKLAGRKYTIEYVSIMDDSLSKVIIGKFSADGRNFREVFQDLPQPITIFEQELLFDHRQHPVIFKELYKQNVNVNQILGPIKNEDDGSNIFIKIIGWKNRPAIGEQDSKRRLMDVHERLTEIEALDIYAKYVHKVMKNKTVTFNRDVYEQLVNILGPYYFERNDDPKDRLFKTSGDDVVENPLDSLSVDLKMIIDEPLLTIDSETWTVRDLSEEIEIHPLVYRVRKMHPQEFGKYFRLAVVDLIRDKYLAKEAYKKGYDKVDIVRRNVEMWRDSHVAIATVGGYLKQNSITEKDPLKLVSEYLNPLVDSLQKKYSDQIKINTKDYYDINLTRIDMVATQTNVPFPVAVPLFPILTDDHNLDYGKVMDLQ